MSEMPKIEFLENKTSTGKEFRIRFFSKKKNKFLYALHAIDHDKMPDDFEIYIYAKLIAQIENELCK